MLKVFVVNLLLPQEQVVQVVVDKVIQVLNLALQKLEQQETLHQQLLLKEILVEMEFNLVVLQTLKLLVEVVELELLDQMLFNQVLVLVLLVQVELDLQLILQVHVALMVAVVAVEKECQLVDVKVQVELEVVVQVVMDLQHKQLQVLLTLAVAEVEQE